MAWINYEYLKEKKMSPEDFLVLQTIKQNKSEDRADDIEYLCQKADLFYLEEEGLVEYIKGTKKDSKYKKMRLSKKGQTVLDDLETPGIIEDDVRLYEWLKAEYESSDRVVGNRKKTKSYIAYFRSHSQINRNKLAFLCQTFLSDDSQMKYSQKLEYMFFKPPNVYSTRFDLEESRLYKYYVANKEAFDKEFEKLN